MGIETSPFAPAVIASIADEEHDYDKELAEISSRFQDAKLQSSEKKPERF